MNSQFKKRIQKIMAKQGSIEQQRGMSAIQIAIVLLVGAIILIAGVKMIGKIGDAKVSNELDALGDLKAKTVDYGQYTPTFTTANTATSVLQGLGFFPANAVEGTGSAMVAKGQWGTVTPSVGTVNTAGDSITFTATGYPQTACNQLGLKVDQLADVVSINGTTTKAAGAATAPASVASACTSGTNTIAFTFAK